MTDLVTVLIAVYNTESWLTRCLDSLLAQTHEQWEAVCVDDASTDGSLAILRRYAALDSRIRVIHLDENRGQAHARNVALGQAHGEWTTFLDSDDWVSPDYLRTIVAALRAHPQTDVVLSRLVRVYPSGRQEAYPMKDFESLTGQRAFELSLDWTLHGVYTVRTSLHRRFPYDETCHAYSDDNTTRMHYLAAREVRCCPAVYYYWQRPSSVSHKVDIHYFDYLQANLSMRRQMQRQGVEQRLIDRYENLRWLNVVDRYMAWHHHRRDMRPAEALEALRQLKIAWKSIDIRALTPPNRWKFGYAPLRPCWALFRLEEELYFTLRRLLFRR